jgi:hypothetical protein
LGTSHGMIYTVLFWRWWWTTQPELLCLDPVFAENYSYCCVEFTLQSRRDDVFRYLEPPLIHKCLFLTVVLLTMLLCWHFLVLFRPCSRLVVDRCDAVWDAYWNPSFQCWAPSGRCPNFFF